VLQGPDEADDHVNLATLRAAGDGRIFVAVKTSLDSPSRPAIKVLERAPGTGGWLSHTVSTGRYRQTRPIVLVDESASVLHVFSSDEGGGGIYHKSAPLSNVSFADGKGELVMWDESSPEINDATSTKQNLDRATGLVVLGSNGATRRYWHHHDPLGNRPPPAVAPGWAGRGRPLDEPPSFRGESNEPGALRPSRADRGSSRPRSARGTSASSSSTTRRGTTSRKAPSWADRVIGPGRAHGAVRAVRKNDDPVVLAAITDRPDDL
jgi:hypothetical protein